MVDHLTSAAKMIGIYLVNIRVTEGPTNDHDGKTTVHEAKQRIVARSGFEGRNNDSIHAVVEESVQCVCSRSILR